MIWESWDAFWAMGGYGLYVWGSMGVSMLAWVLEVWTVRMGRQHALQAVCAVMDAQNEEREVSMGDAFQDPQEGGVA